MSEQPEPVAAASGGNGGARNGGESGAPAWLMLIIYGGGAVLYAAWQFTPTAGLVKSYWPILIIAVVAAIALMLLLKPAVRTAGQARVALVTFVLIPAVLMVITGVVILPPQYQAPALRVIFLSVVTLLPPTMYYLFISTRKYSLLNEFVSNLDRLGLLDGEHNPSVEIMPEARETRHRLRVLAYLQKFEAAYGPLPPQLMDEIRATGDVPRVLSNPRSARLLSSGVADVFTAETTPPLVISTVLIGLGWLSMLPPTLVSDWHQAFVPAQMPVYFAFLGAYFFSIQMLFRRYVLRDLRTSAYVAVSMRIILAVLGTWVLERTWALAATLPAAAGGVIPAPSNEALLLTAFVVGVFPPVAWHYVQAVLKKVTFASVAVPSLSTQLPISDLDGLTVWHQSRLEEEDIENIPNMATANLVDLLLNTRVPPDRIIDWVDQAILYTQIGADDDDVGRRKTLRACGIRTASALVDSYWHSDEATMKAATAEEKPIALTVGALLTNPNLRHIQRWRGLPEEPMLKLSGV
jgi:hypothetical protein